MVLPDEVRPGDTLVVPSGYGGADAFGWKPESQEPVPDVGDLCVNDMANAAPGDGSRLIRLRLFGLPQTDTDNQNGEQTTSLTRLVADFRGDLEQGEDEPDLEKLRAALVARPFDSPLTEAVVAQLATAATQVAPYPAGVVLTARVRRGRHRLAAGGDLLGCCRRVGRAH